MSLMSVQNADIIYGPKPSSVFSMIDSGETPEGIRKKTGHTIAISGASLSLHEGEIDRKAVTRALDVGEQPTVAVAGLGVEAEANRRAGREQRQR